MRKKMIALSLSSILLFGCGATKPTSDGCCEKVVMTQEDHHERYFKWSLFYGLITYAIFSHIEK